jgi:hypothetical protein
MSRGTDIAAQTLGTAAAAANAVPVFGQFASIGLGIASAFTKLFGNIEGPRKKKRKRAREARQRMVGAQRRLAGMGAAAGVAGGAGQLQTGGQMPETVMSPQPPTPMYVEDGVQTAAPQVPQQTLGTTRNG